MEPDLIYDVGMGNGDDTAHYLSAGYRVVAVEANRHLVNVGHERFRGLPVSIVEAAISDRSGFADFWINDRHTDFSSLYPDIAGRRALPRRETVATVPLTELLNTMGTPYYLKVDIEKADVHCMTALVGRSDLPAYVSVEAHTVDYLDLLVNAGYKDFKLLDQSRLGREWLWTTAGIWGRIGGWGDRQLSRVRRRLLGWPESFRYGSSGPFAEDTPGLWLGREEVARMWSVVETQRGVRLLDPWGWFDFHARLRPPVG